MEVPDGPHDGRPIAAAVVGDGVVDDEVADGVVLQAVAVAVSYTHLRAHETVLDLVCRLLLEKKKEQRDRER